MSTDPDYLRFTEASSRIADWQSEDDSSKALDLSGLGLAKLPPHVIELSELQSLDIHNNPLGRTGEVNRPTNLQQHFATKTQESVFKILGQLTGLRELAIDQHQLEYFADRLIKLSSLRLKVLNTDTRDAMSIPVEILSRFQDGADLLEYYIQTHTHQTHELNEAKVLVVGEANVGKTSLILRLLARGYDAQRKPTEGITIYKNGGVPVNGRNVQLNIWDFGGQEIMHATHQFFLTNRSVYILLLDSTVDEEANRIEYWLEKIKLLGGNSPVIVVNNKSDLKRLALNQKSLSSEYPNIQGFLDLSCASLEGLEDVRNKLSMVVGSLSGVHDDLPLSWFEVKKTLEQSRADFITYKKYQQLCRKTSVLREDEEPLIQLLHDLGAVLSFRGGNLIHDATNVLNPRWVTDGVYKIINNRQVFDSRGILTEKMLNSILPKTKYPKEKQLFIVEMMKKFELCFEIPDGTNRYLIPDLLGKDTLNTGDWNDSLRFEYHYNVFFSSIFSRFMVRTHQIISKETYWRSGVVLEYKLGDQVINEALVQVLTTKRKNEKVAIWIRGNPSTRRDFLAQLRGKIAEVHGSFPRGFQSNVEERVPIPTHPDVSVAYSHLVELSRKTEEYLTPEGMTSRVSVAELLGHVELLAGNTLELKLVRSHADVLQRELVKLREIKAECSRQGKRSAQWSAAGILAGFLLLVVSVFGILTYYGFPYAAIVVSLLLFFSPAIVSTIRGRDWSFGKLGEQMAERRTEKNLKMAAFDADVFDLKEDQFRKLRLEVERLIEQSRS